MKSVGRSTRVVVVLSLIVCAAAMSGAQTAAVVSSPVPGSKLSSTSVTFTWTAGQGATGYRLMVGSAFGTWNYYNTSFGPTVRTATVKNLPSNGSTVAVKLVTYYKVGSGSKRYTYTAYTAPPATSPAALVSPAPGSTLTGATTTFTWSAGTGVSQYSLTVGSTQNGSEYFSNSAVGGTSVTLTNLPTDGRTVYATLGSLIGSSWSYKNYTFTAAGTAPAASCGSMSTGTGATLNGFVPFPATNAWNKDISAAPVAANSSTITNYIGSSVGLHPDFGSGTYNGGLIGIPYSVVDSNTAKVNVNIVNYQDESDLSPAPLTSTTPIEGVPNSGGDNHAIVIDKSGCWLYEFFGAVNSSGSWSASGETVWDLQNYESRPYTWTSVDAAGLPIFAGLVRYDEVASGAIKHAIRFTVQNTKAAFVSPATHWAATNTSSPIPMGMRMRLKASYDVSGFSKENQAILNAMKKYGIIVADNGGNMFISGAPDARWNNDDLHKLGSVTASNFEVVDSGTIYTSANIPQGSAPQINSLSASSMTVSAGTPVTLAWSGTGASYYFMSPQVGGVRGNSVVVTPRATTTYTLTATNAFGRTTATIRITVQ